MHVYKQANFHLHLNRKPYRKWLYSQVVGHLYQDCYKWPSYVREYHEYKSARSPIVAKGNAKANYRTYQSLRPLLLCMAVM